MLVETLCYLTGMMRRQLSSSLFFFCADLFLFLCIGCKYFLDRAMLRSELTFSKNLVEFKTRSCGNNIQFKIYINKCCFRTLRIHDRHFLTPTEKSYY